MPEYNDEKYLKYSRMLTNAIYGLVENTISREDIEEMVEDTLDEAFEDHENA
jgi:hypothetical protein